MTTQSKNHAPTNFTTAMQPHTALNQIVTSVLDKRSSTWQREDPNSAAQALKAIAVELRKQHPELTEISVDYSGGGDSGCIEAITFLGAEAYGSRICLAKELFSDSGIEKAIDELAWDLAYGQNPDFEINEGGQGVVQVLFEDNEWTVHLHHEENIIQTNDYKYTF